MCWVKGHEEGHSLWRLWFVVIYNIYGGYRCSLITSLFCRAFTMRPRELSMLGFLSQLKLACRNQTEGLLGENGFLSWEVTNGQHPIRTLEHFTWQGWIVTVKTGYSPWLLVMHSRGICKAAILVQSELKNLIFLSENKPAFYSLHCCYITVSFKLKYSFQEGKGGSWDSTGKQKVHVWENRNLNYCGEAFS